MKSARRWFLTLCAAAGLAACATTAPAPTAAETAQLRADMIALDRAYIPTLALTGRPDWEPVRKVMVVFDQRWLAFRAKYAQGAPGADAQWTADLAEVEAHIARARALVAEGRDMAATHAALEGVRGTLIETRTRMQMPYYLDALTRYHDEMEDIYNAARGKTGANLDDAALASIRAHTPPAKALWVKARATPIEPELGVDAGRQVQVDRMVKVIDGTLADLERALAGTDRDAIARAAQGVRGPFSALFMSFGDFAPVAPKK